MRKEFLHLSVDLSDDFMAWFTLIHRDEDSGAETFVDRIGLTKLYTSLDEVVLTLRSILEGTLYENYDILVNLSPLEALANLNNPKG